jgi:hypothetical protein
VPLPAFCRSSAFGYTDGMSDAPQSRRRLYHPTPNWLILGLLAAEGLLWLSERFQWFAFNEKKGWTVLIAVASVGVAFLVMLLCFVVSLLFRWRFQFGIRSLLILTVVVALPCSWLAVTMRQAKRQREAVVGIESAGGKVQWSKSSGLAWLRSLLGDAFFRYVASVILLDNENVTDHGLEHLKELSQLESLDISFTKVTDDGLKNLKGLNNLQELSLVFTRVTDAGPGLSSFQC